MDGFPYTVFRFPATTHAREQFQDGVYDTRIVSDDESTAAALADGFHLTLGEARSAHDAAKAERTEQAAQEAHANRIADAKKLLGIDDNAPPDGDNAPPTRAELEAKAEELGIQFKPQLGDRKLAALIDAKLKA